MVRGNTAIEGPVRIESELHNHFAYMSAALGDRDWFVGNRFSAADVQLSFPVEAGAARGPLAEYPNLVRYRDRFESRPAFRRLLERGGPYKFARAWGGSHALRGDLQNQ